MSTRPPSPEALEVVGSWPAGAWLSEAELAEHLAETRPVDTDTADGFLIDGRPLRAIINEARRRSWLISDRHPETPRWGRTPTGATATIDA